MTFTCPWFAPTRSRRVSGELLKRELTLDTAMAECQACAPGSCLDPRPASS